MEDNVRSHLVSPNIWTRALYMVLFAIVYSIAKFILVCTVLFQFFAILFTGSASEPVLKFGNNLTAYVYQLFSYQTFNSEVRPFPFTDWPDEPVEDDNIWTEAAIAAASMASTSPVAAAAPAQPAVSSEQNVEPGGDGSDDNRIG